MKRSEEIAREMHETVSGLLFNEFPEYRIIEELARVLDQHAKEVEADVLERAGDFVYSMVYSTPHCKLERDKNGAIIRKTDEELVKLLLDNISRTQELFWEQDVDKVSIEIPEDEKQDWEQAIISLNKGNIDG